MGLSIGPSRGTGYREGKQGRCQGRGRKKEEGKRKKEKGRRKKGWGVKE
jgi:hypothetical protein